MRERYRICFVCLGNICRSPMAEAVLRAQVHAAGLVDRVEVSSAGTGAWHVGNAADARAMTALTARGYALEHVARQFVAEWFADYDLVVALDRSNLAALRRLAPDGVIADRMRLLRSYDPAATEADLDVPDPYYGGADGFERVLDLVESACAGLLEEVRRSISVRAGGSAAHG